MRTTLILDDDVAARLEQVRRERKISMRELVNQTLRKGLEQADRPAAAETVPLKLEPMRLGELLVPSLDDISAVLELVEGPEYK